MNQRNRSSRSRTAHDTIILRSLSSTSFVGLLLIILSPCWKTRSTIEAFSRLGDLSATSALQRRNDVTHLPLLTRHVLASTVDFPGNNKRNSAANLDQEQFMNSFDLQKQIEYPDTEQELIERRFQQIQERTKTGLLVVNLPLSQLLGVTFRHVEPGRILSGVELDLNSLQILPTSSTLSNSPAPTAECFISAVPSDEECLPTQGIDRLSTGYLFKYIDLKFRGLIVASVKTDSVAWKQGVRPGQTLVTVSPTLGNSRWPTTTLESLRSALVSRRNAQEQSIVFEFQRPVLDTQQQGRVQSNQYELTLSKPLGFSIGETPDGYVHVTRILPNAPTLVQYAIQVGDRILAVDSTLGDTMWPVSTVAGVISACTSRLPGQSITFRLERPVMGSPLSSSLRNSTITASASEAIVAPLPKVNVGRGGASATAVAADKKRELVRRSRDLLKRYSSKVSETKTVQSKLDGRLAALVADKVVEALASESVQMDSVTLSMLMNAYLTCQQPDKAIQIFEASVGLAGDATLRPIQPESMALRQGKAKEVENGASRSIPGRLVANDAALNLYTGTALLQAHSMRGDLCAVQRVMESLHGQSGVVIDGFESAPWYWTGTYGTIQPDTKCYNIAIAAAEKVGGTEALTVAMDWFGKMLDPNAKSSNNKQSTMGLQLQKPEKDVVTYNTILSLFSKEGRFTEAFELFDKMTRSSIRPDKFTYSALAKACTKDGDYEELLFDMRERGIAPDIVIYNNIIKSLCSQKKWSKATRLVTDMESKGISPDSMTYSYLMNAMLQADKPSACLTLFESASANERSSALTQNIHLYTTAITAASVLKDYERALSLVSRMTLNGVRPNLKTMTALMGACLSSGRPDLAVDLYQKIESPDGYAMLQGIRALCNAGSVSVAADIIQGQRRGSRIMSGQQIMLSYQVILQSALERNDFDRARVVLQDLVNKGYIPSLPILRAVTTAFKLDTSSVVDPSGDDINRFRYLLFVLDLLRGRNLPVDGSFYADSLLLGRQIGGSARTVAGLMAESKSSSETRVKQILAVDDSQTTKSIQGWESIYSLLTEQPESKIGAAMGTLPKIPVRVGSRDVRKVLQAEQSVAYNSRKSKKIANQQNALLEKKVYR